MQDKKSKHRQQTINFNSSFLSERESSGRLTEMLVVEIEFESKWNLPVRLRSNGR